MMQPAYSCRPIQYPKTSIDHWKPGQGGLTQSKQEWNPQNLDIGLPEDHHPYFDFRR